MNDPLRGEIWLCDFDPVRGHEQGRKRPALVISANLFNKGPAELAIVLPLTSTDRGIPSHVRVTPPDGGAKGESFVLCEQIRCIAKERFVKRWGKVKPETMQKAERHLRFLLEF